MNPADLHGRLRPSRAGVRLRILAGLAILLVAGLTASSVTGALLMGNYLHKRYVRTLRDSAARVEAVIAKGPQVADGDQLGALLGPPLGSIAVDAQDHILMAGGAASLAPEALLARLDAGRPLDQAPVDVTALAADVVADAHVIHPDRAVTLTAASPALVTGDSARLQQVLRNLVGNAVQHTPAHASVHVTVTTNSDTVQVDVADNGPGIAARDLPRVFERFWRAEASRSRAYGGSGLGLAIVEAIIHAHQGSVTVESAVGVGTTVSVRLDAQRVSGVRDSRQL